MAGPVTSESAYTLEHRSEPASDSGTALGGGRVAAVLLSQPEAGARGKVPLFLHLHA